MKLTVKQAAELKEVSVARILQLIYKGTIRARKFGSMWSIDEAELEKVDWDRKPGPKGPHKKPPGGGEIMAFWACSACGTYHSEIHNIEWAKCLQTEGANFRCSKCKQKVPHIVKERK